MVCASTIFYHTVARGLEATEYGCYERITVGLVHKQCLGKLRFDFAPIVASFRSSFQM